MGLISQQLQQQFHRYHTSTERLITQLTKENEELNEEKKYFIKLLNQLTKENEQLKEEIRLLQTKVKSC